MKGKLEDHVVVIDGVEYVKLVDAQIVMYENTLGEIENAQKLIKDAFKGLNDTISDT